MNPDRPPTVQIQLSTPLIYDVGERSVHCPMVEAEVDGVPTKLIVDTGASVHLLTTEFADRASVTYTPGEPGTDVAGSIVPSHDAGDISISLDGTGAPLAEVVVIDGPEPFAAWGVGGFLSPQRLYPESTVVVDLRANTLLVIDGDPHAVRIHLDKPLGERLLIVGDRHSSGMLGVTASVIPHPAVIGLLDTGAGQTDASAQALSGLESQRSVFAKGVSGASIEAGELPEQVLAVGDARFSVPILGVRDAIPPPDGASEIEKPDVMIGMDVLAGTILAIPPERSRQFWWFVRSPEPAHS